MSRKITKLLKTLAGFSIVSIAIWMSSCGREGQNRAVDDATPSPLPMPAASPAASSGTSPTTSTAPYGSGVPISGSGALSLFSQIRLKMHIETNESDKARLLTEEAQRCRRSGALAVDSSSGIVVPDPKELIFGYEAKHRWPGLDECRRQLWLITSIGPQMRRENLIKLENCSRKAEISKQPQLEDRDNLRELLMAENLTLLCRMDNKELSPAVQEALSLGFIDTWSNLGN